MAHPEVDINGLVQLLTHEQLQPLQMPQGFLPDIHLTYPRMRNTILYRYLFILIDLEGSLRVTSSYSDSREVFRYLSRVSTSTFETSR